jgi:beta-glucosidase
MSTVLLKNEGQLLPLDKSDKKLKIVLIGADATKAYTAGQGSGGVSDSNVAVSPLAAMQELFGLAVTYNAGATAAAAVKAAAAADVAIVFGSAHSGEGHDRADLLFSNASGTERLEYVIAAVAKAQKKTIVVAAVPGQILTDWREDVAAILIPFMPGEQYGNAIADILFGIVPPQAKLPLSFPNK